LLPLAGLTAAGVLLFRDGRRRALIGLHCPRLLGPPAAAICRHSAEWPLNGACSAALRQRRIARRLPCRAPAGALLPMLRRHSMMRWLQIAAAHRASWSKGLHAA